MQDRRAAGPLPDCDQDLPVQQLPDKPAGHPAVQGRAGAESSCPTHTMLALAYATRCAPVWTRMHTHTCKRQHYGVSMPACTCACRC